MNYHILRRWIISVDIPISVQIPAYIILAYITGIIFTETFYPLRAVTGFLLLSFVPGFLIMGSFRECFRSTDLLYAIGLSVSISMLLGWLLNGIHILTGIFVPFERWNISIFYLIAYSILLMSMWKLTNSSLDTQIYNLSSNYNLRILIIISIIPVSAIIGVQMMEKYGHNEIILLVLFVVGIVPITVLYFSGSDKYHEYVVGMISLTLMIVNAIPRKYNREGELSVARTVIESGFWTPQGTIGSMPRIGVLHPTYSLVMDISLFWEFKIVHPILFALTPIIVYKISKKYFSTKTAFMSAALYLFLPRNHIFLSQNTRTGSAVLFVAFFILAFLDDEIPIYIQACITIIFLWSIVSSHYGIGPLFLFSLLISYVLSRLAAILLLDKSKSKLRYASMLSYPIVTYGMYDGLSSDTFEFLITSIYKQLFTRLFNTSTSTATRSLSYDMPSASYVVQYYGHIIIPILISVSLILVCIRFLLHGIPYLENYKSKIENFIYPSVSETTLRDTSYICLSVSLYIIIPLSFGPIPLSAGRVFGLIMIVLCPFVVLSLKSEKYEWIGHKPIGIALMIFFLFTSGFVPAVITHDVSPNPSIDQERIVESGSTHEKFAYFRSRVPATTVHASGFIQSYIPNRHTVERTRLSRYKPQFDQTSEGESGNPEFMRLNESDERYSNYVFLARADIVTGTSTQQWVGFIYYRYHPIPSYEADNKIYSIGKDEIISRR